jgi:AcrR family transcriptional regulator
MRKANPTLRQRQAQATRALIISTARSLFLERGYTRTTIEIIAEKAGVSVSTVYTVFGSKRGILRLIREEWHHQTHIKEFLVTISAETDPNIMLDGFAQATRLQWQMGAQVIAIYRGAATADRSAADELATALAGRRKNLDEFTTHLAPHLQPGVDIQQASAILRALCRVEVYEELVENSDWTGERYQEWLATALKRELLEK